MSGSAPNAESWRPETGRRLAHNLFARGVCEGFPPPLPLSVVFALPGRPL